MVTQSNLKNDLKRLMNDLKESVAYEASSLFVLDDHTQKLKEIIKRGEGIDFINSVHFSMGKGLSAWVAQKGQQIYLPDIHRGSRHGLNPIRSYLSIPLEINEKVVGVLNLGHTVPNAFDTCLQTINTICQQAARKIYHHYYIDYLYD